MCIILPIFWACWEILNAPVRLILALFSFIAFVCTLVYEMFGELWSSACSLVHIASTTEATVTATYEVSMWRSLWNDLFSKVFDMPKFCFCQLDSDPLFLLFSLLTTTYLPCARFFVLLRAFCMVLLLSSLLATGIDLGKWNISNFKYFCFHVKS